MSPHWPARAPRRRKNGHAHSCASGSSRYARHCDGIGSTSFNRTRESSALFVARDRGQAGYVLQQDAAPLQVEDAVLAPGLKLPVDAFTRRTDEDAELLLRDVHLGAETAPQRAEPPPQPPRQRLEHRFFHALALPADALAQQLDDLDRDLRLTLEKGQEILPPQHEQFRHLARGRIR